MARVKVEVHEFKSDGFNITDNLIDANADGFEVPNGDGQTMFVVVNNDAASKDVTVITPEERADVVPVDDPVVTVDAGDMQGFGKYVPATFNQPGGSFYVNFSAVTSVKFIAFKNG